MRVIDLDRFINAFYQYWKLLKSLQTGLLTLTGIAGYMSASCPFTHWTTMTCLVLSLLLSIGGSTVLNMCFDRDIDQVMNRTHHRPLVEGKIPPHNALLLGIVLSGFGVLLGVFMHPIYGSILLTGIFFDVLVYTIWLKRRTCWSIVWGGFAGGMPILAGRSLGMGGIDPVGVLLMFSVIFWIPTHMLTFSLRYSEDYQSAGIPTFSSTYGETTTRKIIAASSILAPLLMITAAILIRVNQGYLHLLGILSGGLMVLSFISLLKPSNKRFFSLFKYASLYMTAAMILLAI
jgi:heme o synthase